MTDFLKDQAYFMAICSQTVGQNDPKQTAMYQTLLEEEMVERAEAIEAGDKVEEFDADLDMLVVHLGRMISRWPLQMIYGGWAEVMRSNLSKAVKCETCGGTGSDPNDYFAYADCLFCGGKGRAVQRREDGKIQKGPEYSAPDLKTVMEKYGDPMPKL